MSATRRRVLHLSDLHLNASGELRYGVDADLALGAVLESCASLGELAAVIVTGDVADDGSEAAYNRARDVLLDFARTRRARLVFCVGNHDDRDAFTRSFGSGHIDADGNDCGVTAGPAGRVCAVSEAGGVRIVTLDSLVPGRWYGHLGTEQLRWVAAVLTSEQPAILAFHHPPIDLAVEIQQRVGLDDRDRLAAVVGPSLVSAILCGHFHQQIAGSVNGVPTWVTPGVFTRIDHLTGVPGSERAYAGGSATLLDITEPTRPVFATIPMPGPGSRLAYETDLESIEGDLRAFGIPM
jgi:3',5'-cyclic AMP phosphodiesterase CpdA